MPAASRALRRFQLGPETTPGTAVAATFKLVGNATATIEIEREMEDFPRQTYAPVTDGGIDLRHGTPISFEGNATFEELLHVLASVIEIPTTAGEGPYTHTFDRPWDGPPTLKAYTAEWTETDGATKHVQKEAAYLTGSAFEIGIASGEITTVKWDAFARKSADTTETPALAALTGREPIPSALWAVYLDDAAGGIGGTLLSDVVRSATLSYGGAVVPAHNLEGRAALDFTGIRHLPFTPESAPTLAITMELAASAGEELAHYIAGDKRFVRLTATSGAKSITFDGCWVHASPPEISEDEGVVLATFNLRLESDATLTFEAALVNALADLAAV